MIESHSSSHAESPTLHLTVWFALICFFVIISLSVILKVEVVATGNGKIIPLSRVQIIQSEFEGKITSVNVQNSDYVQQGQVLARLDKTAPTVEANTINNEIRRLKAEGSRITSLNSALSNDIIIDDEFAIEILKLFDDTDLDHFHDEQKQLLETEIENIRARFNLIEARLKANESSAAASKASIDHIESMLRLQMDRVEIFNNLLNKNVGTKLSHLDTIEKLEKLKDDRNIYTQEFEQNKNERISIIAERDSFIAAERLKRLQRLSDIQDRLRFLDEQIKVTHTRIEATRITAPIGGIIDRLSINTLGGTVSAGQELMRIVPEDNAFIIESIFSNDNIAFMKVGQKVNINLDAYPAERFGYINGIVKAISADSVEYETSLGRTWGFTVQIKPSTNYLQFEDIQIPLQVGMTLKADAITEKRRILSYFFAPIIDTMKNSLGER